MTDEEEHRGRPKAGFEHVIKDREERLRIRNFEQVPTARTREMFARHYIEGMTIARLCVLYNEPGTSLKRKLANCAAYYRQKRDEALARSQGV